MNQPMQPLAYDEKGVLRFKANAIVQYILDNGGTDLNKIACLPFSKEDRQQFAQLIGYSLSGYGSLSYVDNESYETAEKIFNEGLSEDSNMSNNENAIEQEIQDKGLTAPRLTPALIDAAIDSETYTVLPSGRVTICEMTLKNGFVVLGESSCVSKENFNAELGQKIARENARNKIWELEGYLLKQRLFEQQNCTPIANFE